MKPPQDTGVALVEGGANPHGQSDVAVVAVVEGQNSKAGANGPLTAEQREALKRERDRVVREQLPAKDAALQEDCRRLQAEADEAEHQAPFPGDDMFPVLLANAVRGEHITAAEAKERLALHKLIVRASSAA
jgi:hypothetical protein